jgi:hypothetical protein
MVNNFVKKKKRNRNACFIKSLSTEKTTTYADVNQKSWLGIGTQLWWS